eukprot:1160274-Pelagomonas_calceolata.AAC.1
MWAMADIKMLLKEGPAYPRGSRRNEPCIAMSGFKRHSGVKNDQHRTLCSPSIPGCYAYALKAARPPSMNQAADRSCSSMLVNEYMPSCL